MEKTHTPIKGASKGKFTRHTYKCMVYIALKQVDIGLLIIMQLNLSKPNPEIFYKPNFTSSPNVGNLC
jgi:hypothetical protein